MTRCRPDGEWHATCVLDRMAIVFVERGGICLRRTVTLLTLAFGLAGSGPLRAEAPPAGLVTIQIAGRGRTEGGGPGDRFQGRFILWALEGAEQSVLGPDVSLFEPGCVTRFGRGAGCAHLVAVLNGLLLETFDTSSVDFVGHLAVRTASSERLRVFFDPAPDGSRDFEELASFEIGEPVAVYKVREFLTIDPTLQLGVSRNVLELLESRPFTLGGVAVDFKDVAPRLAGVFHTRFPEPDPLPDPVPTDEPPFGARGSGFFLLRFPVSGFFTAVDSQ